jgi:PhnB protein
MQINPYLSFNGQCEQALRYYEQHLGAKVEMMMTYGASPMADQTPPDQRGRIMHATFKLDGQTLSGADAPPQHYRKPEGMSLLLGLSDVAQAERIFQALAVNGEVKMPMQQTFWAERFGVVIDQFGTPWMINCERPAMG